MLFKVNPLYSLFNHFRMSISIGFSVFKSIAIMPSFFDDTNRMSLNSDRLIISDLLFKMLFVFRLMTFIFKILFFLAKYRFCLENTISLNFEFIVNSFSLDQLPFLLL